MNLQHKRAEEKKTFVHWISANYWSVQSQDYLTQNSSYKPVSQSCADARPYVKARLNFAGALQSTSFPGSFVFPEEGVVRPLPLVGRRKTLGTRLHFSISYFQYFSISFRISFQYFSPLFSKLCGPLAKKVVHYTLVQQSRWHWTNLLCGFCFSINSFTIYFSAMNFGRVHLLCIKIGLFDFLLLFFIGQHLRYIQPQRESKDWD